jgi:hypothetical protein
MTIAPEPTNDNAGLVREPDLPVANDNELSRRRAPRLRVPSSGEPAKVSVEIRWRYSEARLALARALGEIAADLWLSGKLPLTEDHSVATIAHSHAALSHDADQERDRQAQDLGA